MEWTTVKEECIQCSVYTGHPESGAQDFPEIKKGKGSFALDLKGVRGVFQGRTS